MLAYICFYYYFVDGQTPSHHQVYSVAVKVKEDSAHHQLQRVKGLLTFKY